MLQHTPNTMATMLGARVRQLRKAKKLSMEALGERAGVGAGTVRAIESGSGCNMQSFMNVLDALGALSSMGTVLLEETRPAPAISVTSRSRRELRGREPVSAWNAAAAAG